MSRRVAVVGMGAVCPIGNNVAECFSSLKNGKSGIEKIPHFASLAKFPTSLDVLIGGEVKNFDPTLFVEPKKDVRRMDKFMHFALAAAHEAWHMASLPDKLPNEDAINAGCILGVGLMGIEFFLNNYDALLEKGPGRVSPFFIPGTISNLAPGHIAIRRNLKADNFTVVSACASGTHAIGEAFLKIKYGAADLMVAGGAESSMHHLAVAGFDNMHALCSSMNDNPKNGSRPFDKTRDGFVMGEGAGVLILEEYERAKKRGANIICEVTGYGSSCDANHITAPAEGGEGAQRAMKQALNTASLNIENIDYINAHGTSTPLNDKVETDAIKAVFKDHAKKLWVSSTKSMTGHLLGAAGGIEAVFSALAIKHSFAPPTINLNNPDPECDLDYVANIAREKAITNVMSNSFGFGGTNAVIVLSKI